MDRIAIGSISFQGEQDGPLEREIQRRITETLLVSDVHRAYLAKVLLNETPVSSVALCLVGGLEHGQQIVDAVGDVVRELLHETQSLDITFISPEQEADLKTIARPFFVSPDLHGFRPN